MKLMILEVREEVVHRSGVSASTGKPYDLHIQTAYLHTGDEYPVRSDILLSDGIVTDPGKYLVSSSAIQQDRKSGNFYLNPGRGFMTLSDAIGQLQELHRSEARSKPAPVAQAA